MKYQVLEFQKIPYIKVDNENGLQVVFTPVGASIKSIIFNNEEMLLTPKNDKDFFKEGMLLGKSTGPFIVDSALIGGKEYQYNDDYRIQNFLFRSNPNLNKKYFSVVYRFEKKKKKDGLPNKTNYFISFSIGESSSELLVDYRAMVDSVAPVSISNNLVFNLSSKHLNELYLTVPTNQSLENKSFIENLSLKKKRNFDNADSNGIYKLNGPQIILENSKYSLEITTTDYECVEIKVDNEIPNMEFENLNGGIKVSPIDNISKSQQIDKKTIYHRQISYKFFKK